MSGNWKADVEAVRVVDLLRLAVSTGSRTSEDVTKYRSDDSVDWRRVYGISYSLRVPSIVNDGLRRSMPPENSEPSGYDAAEYSRLRFEWAGWVVKVEKAYAKQEAALRRLGEMFSSHGLGLMLLKGYGMSLNYPVPNHRPSGDIDCFMFYREGVASPSSSPAWEYADKVIASVFGVTVDDSFHHHSIYYVGDIMVENHYDFFNVPSHRSNRTIEARFKELAWDRGKEILPNVFLPSPNFNALFVIRHAAVHFAAKELDLRQLLDWMLLIRATSDEIDWRSFWKDAAEMGMMPFVRAVVSIATDEFGFDERLFHLQESDATMRDGDVRCLADRVLDNLFHPDFQNYPDGFFRLVVWKARRWWAHRWKHRMVYRDSLVSTFFFQLFAHLIKPKSLLVH